MGNISIEKSLGLKKIIRTLPCYYTAKSQSGLSCHLGENIPYIPNKPPTKKEQPRRENILLGFGSSVEGFLHD
jgi:hypothetical protein